MSLSPITQLFDMCLYCTSSLRHRCRRPRCCSGLSHPAPDFHSSNFHCRYSGLIYTLCTSSSKAHWIGYQIVVGLGIGACFQVPIMAGQALASPEDVSLVTSILLCNRWFRQTVLGYSTVCRNQRLSLLAHQNPTYHDS